MKVVNILSDYHRQGIDAELTAILSFIQEKRKKKGFFRRREEVISSIRRCLVPIVGVEVEGFYLLCDGFEAFSPSYRLESVKSWETEVLSALHGENEVEIAEGLELLGKLSPLPLTVKLEGVMPSEVFLLLENTRDEEADVQVPTKEPSERLVKALSRIPDLEELRSCATKMRELILRVQEMGDRLDMTLWEQISRLPENSEIRKRLEFTRSRLRAGMVEATRRMEEAAEEYERLMKTLTSAPQLDLVVLPVYLVETRGRERRRFFISNLRFRRPGMLQRVEKAFGRFDSLFDETDINRALSSCVAVERIPWGPNLMTEELEEVVYGELARLQEEGYIDEDYIEGIAGLISKSLI